MMMELMGLHIPGAAFINPGTPLRQALTRAAVHRLAELAATKARPLGQVVDERAIVNAAVGLLATGGSTNHAIHMPAIARAAGIVIDWQDLDELSAAVPLIARVYPNGSGDVNDFHHAGGMAFVDAHPARRRAAPRRHPDRRRRRFRRLCDGNPRLDGETLAWDEVAETPQPRHAPPGRRSVPRRRRHAAGQRQPRPRHLQDQRGRAGALDDRGAVPRSSPTRTRCWPRSQAGELDRDVVVVVRFQGPRANGMPELHKLTPALGVLQDKGYQGRAGHRRAHVGRQRQGPGRDPLSRPKRLAAARWRSCATATSSGCAATRGSLEAVGVDLATREPAAPPPPPLGTGRELFAFMRHAAPTAEQGGSAMLAAMESGA